MHVETCTEKPARRQEHVRPAAVPPRRRRGLQVEGPPISYERDEALVWVSTPTVDSNPRSRFRLGFDSLDTFVNWHTTQVVTALRPAPSEISGLCPAQNL